MENERFMQEGIDGKRVLWLVWKKIWFFIGAVFIGAALGAGIYLSVHLLFASQREYEAVSKIYLHFNCDPEDFTELAYNGYTWNDLMATDPILNSTMENLSPEISRDTVIQATKAEILSDIRLLTVTITTDRPELSAQIMEATQAALVHLGEADPLFESIEIYSTSEPKQILWDNRTLRAAATGAVIALFAAVTAAFFYYVMDDSVYVAADVERRYGIPAVGILTEEVLTEEVLTEEILTGDGKLAEGFQAELLANYCYLGRNMGTAILVSADAKEDTKKAVRKIERLMEEKRGAESGRSPKIQLLDGGMPEDGEAYARLREADGVLVAVRFGGKNGKAVERLLGNLRKQDCKVFGVVIVDAKEDFLRMYHKCGKGMGLV